MDPGRVWAFEHALGQHDDGQVPGRSTSQDVPSPPSQPNTLLSQTAWQNPQERPSKNPGSRPPASLLRRGQLVGGHGPHRFGRQHRRPAAQHLGDGEQVVGGGHEPSRPVSELRRAAPLAPGLIEHCQAARGELAGRGERRWVSAA